MIQRRHEISHFFRFFCSLLACWTLGGCTGAVSQKQNATAQSLIEAERVQCAAGQCPCPSPVGPIADGAQIPIYNVDSVSCTDSCQAHSRLVTCKNGKFSEDVTKAVFTCNATACSPCVSGSSLIPHGNAVSFYSTAKADCGESCESYKQVRICQNGKLTGDDTYASLTCEPRECSCRLPDNTGSLTLGGSIGLYSTTQGSCGQKCPAAVATRKCVSSGRGDARTFGFDGDPSFKETSCKDVDPTTCKCALPGNLGTLAHGGTFVLSQVSSVRCVSCASYASMTVVCDSGVLKNQATGMAVTPTENATYPYQCQELECKACAAINGIGSLPDQTYRTVYTKPSLACGDVAYTFSAGFFCNGGNLTKDGVPFNPATDTTTFYSTISNDCKGCNAPWGVTYAFGTKVTAYRSATTTTTTSQCKACQSAEITCLTTGLFSGDGTFTMQQCPNAATCNQEGGGAPPRGCLLPWQNAFVTPGSKIPMWSKKTVNKPDSCANYFKVGTCQLGSGTFGIGLEYIYPACTEL